jgi:hypothetical protein
LIIGSIIGKDPFGENNPVSGIFFSPVSKISIDLELQTVYFP